MRGRVRGYFAAACAVAAAGCDGDQAGVEQIERPAGILVSDGRLPEGVDGAQLYQAKCAMCHEGRGMGSGLLSRRMEVAELSKRGDLAEDFVFSAARMGMGNMPAIPPGEVSDEQLRLIASHLSSPQPDR